MNPKHYDRCPKCKTELNPEYIRKVAEAETVIMDKINEMASVTCKLKILTFQENLNWVLIKLAFLFSLVDLDVCESCVGLMNSLNFSDTHWMKTHMAYAAFEACIDKQYWDKAFEYGQLALKGHRYVRYFNADYFTCN